MDKHTQSEYQEYTKNKMQEIAQNVKRQLPPDWGFVVLAFPFCDNGKANYVSNCNREDVINAMHEFINRTVGQWERHLDDESEDCDI